MWKQFFRIFFEIFLKSLVSRIAPKNVKGGPFGIFWTSILLQKNKKLKGDPFETKKLRKKVSQSQNYMHKKIWSKARPEPMSFAGIKVYWAFGKHWPRRLQSFFIFRPYSIWERKIFKSNAFFRQNLSSTEIVFNFKVLPIEFNSHKYSFVRFEYKAISGPFLVDPNDPEWPKKEPQKKENLQKLPIFYVKRKFLWKFRQTSWIGMLKRVNKERLCCPVRFSEEFIVVF